MKRIFIYSIIPIFSICRMINILLRVQSQGLGVSVVKQYGYYYTTSHPDTTKTINQMREQSETTVEKVLPSVPMAFNDLDLPLTIKLDKNCFNSIKNKQNVPKFAHISLIPSTKLGNQSIIPQFSINLVPKQESQASNNTNPIMIDMQKGQISCTYEIQHITQLDQQKIKQIFTECIEKNPEKVEQLFNKWKKQTTENKQSITSQLWSSLIKIAFVLLAVGLMKYHYHIHSDSMLI